MGRATLVEHVRDQLLASLQDGEFGIGDKLPNEDVLASRFEVSRATIRDAVRVLVEGGFVKRIHGSGTYVTRTSQRLHSLEANLSYTEMIRSSGAEAGIELLSRTRRTADDDETEQLRLGVDDLLVVEVERVRTADGRPVVYSVDRIPAYLVGDDDLQDLGPSLYAYLSTKHHAVTNGYARLLPVAANAKLARILRVVRGTPLMHINQIDTDNNDRPVLLSAEWHLPGAFEFRISRRNR